MREAEIQNTETQIYYRLIALWIVCEAMLGGIIHGIKLPVSGLIIGSCAVIIICLIGFYTKSKGAILKATVIVLIFKMMLSPQSPFTAYIAVLFQGVLGELLFMNKRFYKISCMVLGFLALFESGVQKILVMIILFGSDFWKAVNAFISSVTKQETITNYSLYIAVAYVLLHIAMGLAIGWYTGRIPDLVRNWKKSPEYFISTEIRENKENIKKKSKFKTGLFIIWIILLLLFIQSYFGIGKPVLPPGLVIQVLVRSVLILLSWYFFVSPLLLKLMKRWLENKKSKLQNEINEILVLIPQTENVIYQSWKISNDVNGLKRLKKFCKIVLMNSLPQ